jgi:hypothetical protein
MVFVFADRVDGIVESASSTEENLCTGLICQVEAHKLVQERQASQTPDILVTGVPIKF